MVLNPRSRKVLSLEVMIPENIWFFVCAEFSALEIFCQCFNVFLVLSNGELAENCFIFSEECFVQLCSEVVLCM